MRGKSGLSRNGTEQVHRRNNIKDAVEEGRSMFPNLKGEKDLCAVRTRWPRGCIIDKRCHHKKIEKNPRNIQAEEKHVAYRSSEMRAASVNH